MTRISLCDSEKNATSDADTIADTESSTAVTANLTITAVEIPLYRIIGSTLRYQLSLSSPKRDMPCEAYFDEPEGLLFDRGRELSELPRVPALSVIISKLRR